jgi:phenylacetate-CoA ligase
MKKTILKKVRDNLPEFVNFAAAGIIRKKLIENETFINQYTFLTNENIYKYSEFIKKYQFTQLKNILIHARDNVPYYTRIFNEVGFIPEKIQSLDDVKIIPLLTKNLIQENYDELISRKIPEKGFYKAATSGTSGNPLQILLDYQSIFIENAFIYSYRKRLGYDFKDKLATFRGSGANIKNKKWKFNPMYNELVFSPFKLSPATLKSYLKRINKFKPDYIHGFMSTIYYFAKLLKKENLSLNYKPKGIFYISEAIEEDKRNFIDNFFEVPSFTFYGHSERCIIAPEIKKNIYRFDPFYGYTEFENNDDGTHTIIGTGFFNTIMPLIRYKTDDACKESGDGYKIFSKRDSTIGLYGKNMEFFTHSPLKFQTGILKNIINYQYVQDEPGKAKLLIITKNVVQYDANDYQKEINKKTRGLIDLEVEIVDKLILSPRGKFIPFINNVTDN